ncbi:MAG: hypothetical protein WC511_02245 [Candidatus Pacearchaeota archaeon]
MKKEIRPMEPLKSFPDYSNSTKESFQAMQKISKIYFVDETFKPLSVNKTKIASVKEMTPYKNHLAFLPKIGEQILVGEKDAYTVINILHSLPLLHSDVQKVYIVLK